MQEKYVDSTILDRALKFAVDAHANTERRGKGIPYIIHPIEVVAIVATMTKDQELMAAAALHDVVEDTSVTSEEIAREFGNRVAAIVSSESDIELPQMSYTESWKIRKNDAICRLKRASIDSKMVALGDKLSNMRLIYRDFKEKGDDLWKIFHVQDPLMHKWYFTNLVESLRELDYTDAFREFAKLVDKVFSKYQ